MRSTINHDSNSKLDLYHFGYQMMLTTFKNADIKIGIRNALFLTKMFTQSSDVLLYRKNNKTGEYDLYINALMIKNNRKNNVEWLKIFINKGKALFEGQGVKNVDCSDISDDKEITLIPLITNHHKYVLVIRNCNIYDAYKNKGFMEIINANMLVMLKQLESYNMTKREGSKDELTGLDSRAEFAKMIKELSKSNEKYTYVLFDLLGLKTINDNYGYMMGDAYILKASEILKNYFTKYYIVKDTAGIQNKVRTGSCIYRTGGDEFILISKSEPMNVIEEKLARIEREVANIKLNTTDTLYLGINYGLATKEGNETVRELSATAFDKMKAHKEAMYERYREFGVHKRKQFVKTDE